MSSESQRVLSEEEISGLYKLDKPRYFAWVLYDVANTFYASGILTLIILTLVLVVAQNNGYSYGQATSIYNVVLAGASIFMAVMLPILGAISDIKQQRRNYVILFSSLSILSTAVFVYTDNFWVLLVFFAISLISYQWAQVFYDSMLPGVVPPGKEARLSSIAIALGYFGGFFITLYAYYLNTINEAPNSNPAKGPLTLGYYQYLYLPIIIGFALLTIPMFYVKETDWSKITKIVDLTLDDGQLTEDDLEEIKRIKEVSIMTAAKKSFRELYATFVDIKRNNIGMFYYIIAYFIIADLANLIVGINITYMRDALKLEENEIFTILAISGSGLIFLSFFVGLICDKWGAKRGFQVIGVLWVVALSILILEGIFLPQWTLYIAALLLGPALSGVWISQRQMVLELVPDEQSLGKYFGLTKFSGKLSSAIGPLIFGFVFILFNEKFNETIETSYRISIFILTLFLIVGFLILHYKVPNKHEEFKEKKQIMLLALKKVD